VTPTPTSQHHSSGSSDTKCETVDLAPRIGAWYGPAAAQYSVGDGPLQLDPERRAARRFLRPSARGELQTTGTSRARLAGCGQRPIRPLAALRSRVYDLPRARAARPVRCGRVNRPPEVCRSGAAATNWAAPLPQSRSVVGRWRAGQRQLMASWALAGVPRCRWWVRGAGCCCARRALGAARSSTKCIGTRSHHPPSRHGWRAARRRPAGAASVAARLSDAPAWTRRWDADARRRRCRLVAVRGAATHPYIVLVQVRRLPSSAA
jgi:hypothetical protein